MRLSESSLLLLVSGATAACMVPTTTPVGVSRPSSPTDAPPGLSSAYYRLTVVSAAIEARRPDGSPWHTQKPDQTWAVIGAVAGLVIGQPELGTTAGSLLAGDESYFGPAPRVEVHVGGAVYRTTAMQPNFAPTWNEELLVDARSLRTSDVAAILVRDAVDGGVIAQMQIPVGQLFARDAHTLSGFGSVATLNLRTEPTTPRYDSVDMWVPANVGASNGPRARVDGGHVVTIRATGEACLKRGRCFGPGGDPTQEATGMLAQMTRYRGWQYSYREFQDSPHGELAGFLCEHPIDVGVSASYRVPHWVRIFRGLGKLIDSRGLVAADLSGSIASG